jgi:hypothetical protein
VNWELEAQHAHNAAATLRQDLVELAREWSPDRIMATAFTIARNEEIARVYHLAHLVIQSDDGQLVSVMTEQLAMSSDDTWSGRGNELKREVADARRMAAKRVLDHS